MIDDEKLQELLTKASSLYHNGEYKEAIVAWRAALSVDPASQKAQEGIRMATLLLADWEPPTEAGDEGVTPADGADTEPPDLSAEEMEARVDLGIARVRQLLSERKYAEALEGARGLAPQHPDSEEVRRLLEEAQQAYESAPFVEEHFTLARELVQQERFAEAEAQCRKVLALDTQHREASELLAQIRNRIGDNLERAAEQLGEMTVKLSAEQLKDPGAARGRPSGPAQRSGPDSLATTGTEPAAKPEAVASPAPDEPEPAVPDPAKPGGIAPSDVGGEEPFELTHDSSLADGVAAASQEEVAARAALDAAFAGAKTEPDPMASIDQDPAPPAADPAATIVPTASTDGAAPPAAGPSDPSMPIVPDDGMPDLEALGISVEGAFAETAASSTEAPGGPAAQPATPPPGAPAASAEPVQSEAPTVVEAKTVRPPTDRLIPSQPVPDIKAPGPEPPAAGAPEGPRSPSGPPSGDDEQVSDAAAWEQELTQLNLKVGERDMMKGTGTKPGHTLPGKPPQAPAGAPTDEVDADLMALLETDLGGPGDAPAAPTGGGIPLATMGESETTGIEGTGAAMPARTAATKPGNVPGRDGMTSDLLAVEIPKPQTAPRKAKPRKRVPPPAPFREPSRAPRYFALFGLLLLVGGAAVWWHFFFQPRMASNAGAPSQPGPPPFDPGRDVAAVGADPIPTPIGGGGKSTPREPQSSGGQVGVETPAGEAAEGAVPEDVAPPDGELTPDQIKPEPPPLTPAEKRRKIAEFRSEGQRMLEREDWRAARAAFQAALALDPVNFEIKDLADIAQVRLDEERKLQGSFESAKKLFNQGEYQDCLWKLYRLPRDRGLGDIDLYIRNAWYNWAAISLKAGDPGGALEKVSEVLQVDPTDQGALKIEEVAEKYRSRRKDRIYYAFAQKLELRTIGER